MSLPTVKEIEIALMKHIGARNNILVPNISWGFDTHEIDLLWVKKSGMIAEIEIKRSVADMKADMKKEHHHKSDRIAMLYFAVPEILFDKFLPLVPNDAGIFTYKEYVSWSGESFISVKDYRKATKVNKHTITIEEAINLSRLTALRYWNIRLDKEKKKPKQLKINL